MERISPELFLTLRSMETKYQKRDLAMTSLDAKICIFQMGVTGSFSVGSLRPITVYSRSSPFAFVGMLHYWNPEKLQIEPNLLTTKMGFEYPERVEQQNTKFQENDESSKMPNLAQLKSTPYVN